MDDDGRQRGFGLNAVRRAYPDSERRWERRSTRWPRRSRRDAPRREQIASVVAFCLRGGEVQLRSRWCTPTGEGRPSDGQHTCQQIAPTRRRPCPFCLNENKHPRNDKRQSTWRVNLEYSPSWRQGRKKARSPAFSNAERTIAAAEKGTVTGTRFKLDDSTYGIS